MAAKKTKARTKSAARPQRASRSTRPTKPIFGTATWVMLVLFAGLLIGFFFLKNQKESAEAAATPANETTFVFDAVDGLPTSIEVKPADGIAVKVARNAEKNVWVMELPFKTGADQGAVEAAAVQLGSLNIVGVVDGDPEIFGVNHPIYIITVEFSNGEKHTLDVGDSTPTNSGYYVRLDKDQIMIVGLSGIDALANLAFFPPYLNTPTPSALPATEKPASSTQTPAP